MNFSPDFFQKNQNGDASRLGFVPSDEPTAEVHHQTAEVHRPPAEVHRLNAIALEAGRPLLQTKETRRGLENEVHVPMEELRLLASHSSAGGDVSTKRTSRVRVGLLVGAVLAVAAFLGWHHRGDEIKQMAALWSAAWAPRMSVSLVNPSGVSVVEKENPSASRGDPPSTVGSEQVAAQTAAPDRTAATADELQQQLQSIAYNLSLMKQNLDQLAAKQEQLAAKQEQMSRDIAALGAVKQEDKVNTGSARPRSAALPPRKKPQTLPPPAAAAVAPAPQTLSSERASTGQASPQQDVVVRPPMPLRRE